MSKKPTPKAPAAEPVMKRYNVFMPQAMIDGLEQVAHIKGETAAAHLRKGVAQYLKRFKL